MKISFPFNMQNQQEFLEGLSRNIALRFKLKHWIYYAMLRPLLSRDSRIKAFNLYKRKTPYNPNFIYEDYIKILKEDPGFETLAKNLYPGDFSCAIAVTHDVEGDGGLKYIPRILEMEARYGIKSSWNIVPNNYKIDQGIINLIYEAGDEIGIHGYNHDGLLYSSERVFKERASFINKAIEFYKADGFRSPMVHHSLSLLQYLDIQYDSSCFDYDPFQPFPDSLGIIWPFKAGKFIEIPYTVPQDHTIFYALHQKDINIWKKKTSWLVLNYGAVVSLTHPDYLMEKNHIKYYEEYLNFLKAIPNAWHCLPRELARWWKQKTDNEDNQIDIETIINTS